MARLIISLIFLLSADLLIAESEQIDRAAMDIYSSIMSPYCPGLLLRDCPSTKANELKTEIRTRLNAGATSSEIQTELVARYGEDIRGLPTSKSAYIGLFGFIAVGLAFLIYGLKIGRAEKENCDCGGKKEPR